MSVGATVTVGVEWIEMVFNVSRPFRESENDKRDIEGRSESNWRVACRVDGVKKVGFLEVAFNSTSAGASVFRRVGMDTGSVVLVALLVGAWVFCV